MEGVVSLDPRFAGIRYDEATKMASVYDVAQCICECDHRYASKIFKRLDQELATKCPLVRISGKGRETPVADAKTLIQIIWALPGKKARAFRVECATYICRILGGDPAMIAEMEYRAATTPPEQREFFMSGLQTPTPPPMQDPEYIKNRCDAADGVNCLTSAMRLLMPKAGRDVFVITQGVISDAILGSWPRAFKEAHDIPDKYNAPDIMLKKQLHLRSSLLELGVDMLRQPGNAYIGSDGQQFVKDFHAQCMMAKRVFSLFHGQYQMPTELDEVRLASSASALPAPAPAPHTMITNVYNSVVNC